MKNRIASLFLVFALLMSLCNFAVARDNRINVQSGGAERFTDVPTSHWAYAYINKVVGSGLFNGRTPTTFEPSNAMTRSQFVMVMARMEGRSDLEGVETQTIFPDVTTTRRAAGPIAWATEQGFVQGFGDGTFKPDSPITRGQFAALIHRYIIAKRYVDLNELDPEPAQFTDAASVSSAFTNDVEYARVHGLLTGYSDGTVRSGNPITRAAIAAILARFLDLVTESGYTPLLDGPVIDGGDSGDSGQTPVDVPTSYDDIKLKVNGSTHGKTSLVATRDGQTVASDDLQPGDRVTITHTPDSGYEVTVRVRDKNNKNVTRHTSGNTTWFEVPTALPVTVTVTYSKASSSGGGGSGGSSSSGGNSGGNNVIYYANEAVTQVPGGVIFPLNAVPNAQTTVPENPQTIELRRTNNSNISGYAVFVPSEGYTFGTASAVDAQGNTVTLSDPVDVTLANNTSAKYVSFTVNGSDRQAAAPTVTVTGTFVGGSEAQYHVNVAVTQATGGVIFASGTTPNESTAVPNPIPASIPLTSATQPVTGYAVFVPSTGYALDTVSVTDAEGNPVEHDDPVDVTLANNTPAKYVPFRVDGGTQSAPKNVIVTGTFTGSGATKVQWTLNWKNVKGGFIHSSENVQDFQNLAEPLTGVMEYTIDKQTHQFPENVTYQFNETGKSRVLYVALSPDLASHFIPGDPNLTITNDGGTVTLSGPEVKLDGQLYIYTLTAENLTQETTTTLTAAFEQNKVAASYGINVLPVQYYDGEKTDTASEELGLRAPTVEISKDGNWQEVNTALAAQELTVFVPVSEGYQVRSLTITGASGTPYTSTENKTPADPAVREFVFKMPAEDVNVQAVFEDADDPDINYQVNVVMNGQGTMTLNVGGQDRQFTESTTEPVPVTLSTSEYKKLYEGTLTAEQFAAQVLPVYLVGEAVPAAGYKFGSLSGGGVSTTTTKDSPSYELTPSNPITVTVTFTQERSFGYNLTIIGPVDTVQLSLDDGTNPAIKKTYSNDTTDPAGTKTESFSTFINDSETVKIAVTQVLPAEGYFFAGSVLIDDTTYAEGEEHTMSPGMVNVVVAVRDKNAAPVAFTVTNNDTNGNTVTIRAENGKFAPGSLTGNNETDKATIDNTGATTATLPTGNTRSRTYLAYSGTIITLVPNLEDGYKVKAVTVNESTDVPDELSAKGFSYTLQTDAPNTMEITFAKFDQYRFLVQAPYQANLSNYDLHSSSQQISGERTLRNVLYSLNNGQRYDSTQFTPYPNDTTPLSIENNIAQTLGNVSKILGVYLNTANSEGTTAAQELADTLEENAQASIEENLDLMVEAQKNEMVQPASGEESDLQKQIKSSLKTELAKVNFEPSSVTLDDDSKAQIIKAILDKNQRFKELYENGTIKFENFNISATAAPLVMSAEETGVEKAAGKSVEAQMPTLITDYLLNQLKVAPLSRVTADVDVTAEDGLITISATAKFTGDLPKLAPTMTFSQYVNPTGGKSKLSIWIKTDATVTLQSTDTAPLDSAVITEFDTRTQTDAFALSNVQSSIDTSSINNTLSQVDTTLTAEWEKKWDTSNPDSFVKSGRDDAGRSVAVMEVSMGDVLTKDMLDTVIEGDDNTDGILGSALETLTNNVKSLGTKETATATKAAIQNIYRDFVVFNSGDNDRLIVIKDKKDDASKYPVLGTIDGNNLVLNLTGEKLEEIFRDVNSLDEDTLNKTSFEKLFDLLTALRDGMSTDIRNNSTKNETAQNVLSGMIQGRIGKNGQLFATKWGTPISSNGSNGRVMTNVEKQELAELTAELMMSPLETSMNDAWANFEAKGYRSVSLTMGLNRLNNQLQTALKNFDDKGRSAFFTLNDLSAGFKMEQALADN